MHILESDLKDILMKNGLITEDIFKSAQMEANQTKRQIIEVLISKGEIKEQYLADYLSGFFRAPIIDLQKIIIEQPVLEMIPESLAKNKGVVLFDFNLEKRIGKLAMLDPGDLEIVEFLKIKFNADLWPHLTTTTSLKFALRQYQKKIGEEFNVIIEENLKKALATGGEIDLGKLAQDIPVVTILNSIMERAVNLDASDIHIEPFVDYILVRYRTEGIMNDILTLPKEIHPIITARVKILANLLIDEHSKPQDGRFRLQMNDDSVDIRVNIMPVFHGEKVEMRLLKGTGRVITLSDLGFSSQSLKVVESGIKKTFGMLLVTGPTGAGKTTTLYATLYILNTPKVNIATIEDPIEYDIPRVNQTQVNAKAGITFATGLRSIVRQNPDIIMIGEIRDAETVDIAINSALTGHLVLSTLHTNDAATAIPRLIDMGAPAFLLASTINTVIAQRLVRKVCGVCIKSYKIKSETADLIKGQAEITGLKNIKIPNLLYKGSGCKVCNFSGYHGQIGIFEVLNVSEAIKNLILKQAAALEIKKKAVEEGMITMFEDGLSKVEAGATSIEEVLRVVGE